jgi:hypothetical protein
MTAPGVGDFGVVAIPGRMGKLIRIGQWLNGDGYNDYEHAFVVTDKWIGGGQVIEGRPSGAGDTALAAYPNAAFYSCPEESREAVADAAVSLIGRRYSWADYLALAAVRFHLDTIAHPLRQYVESSGRLICSQLVDYAYQLAGVQLFDDGRIPGDVTPGDLYGLILEQQKTRTS